MSDIISRIKKLEEKFLCLESDIGKEAGNIVNTITGHRIGTYINNNGISKDFFESVTGLSIVGSNLVYHKEDGDTDIISLDDYIQNSRIVSGYIDTIGNKLVLVRDDDTEVQVDITTLLNQVVTHISLTGNTISYQNEENEIETIDLSKYYITQGTYNHNTGLLTFTRANNNIFVVDLTALKNATGIGTFSNLLSGGHVIGTHNNGAGTVFSLKESICTFIDNGDGTITMTNESGNSVIFNSNPNFTIGTNINDGNPNTNGDVTDMKNGDMYYSTSGVMWFYSLVQDHWFMGGGQIDYPDMFNSLVEALSTLGNGKPFIYSPQNIDGAVAYSQAWTPNYIN